MTAHDELREAVARAIRPRLTVNMLRRDPRVSHKWLDELSQALAADALAAVRAALEVPSYAMQNAAIDVDSFKLGNISPLGFRMSPQQLFTLTWKAQLAASPLTDPGARDDGAGVG